ncbi:MAG: barstar family protein [Lysobacteraceae bacterium]
MTAPGFDFSGSDPTSTGVYLVEDDDLGVLEASARNTDLVVRRIDLHGCINKDDLLQRIAAALAFPPGFGNNWDALSDCVRDLGWLPGQGYVLLFGHLGNLRDASEDDFDTLLDVFDEAAETWAEQGVRFWAFFTLPESAFDALDA